MLADVGEPQKVRRRRVNCRPNRSSCTDGPACRLTPRFLENTDEIRESSTAGHPGSTAAPLSRPQLIGDEAVSLGASPIAASLTAPAWADSVGRPPPRVGARPPDRGRSAKRLAQQSMSSVLGYTTGNDADSARRALDQDVRPVVILVGCRPVSRHGQPELWRGRHRPSRATRRDEGSARRDD